VTQKVKSHGELVTIVRRAKRDGKTVVFTNGCFDLLHPGHVHVLRQAKSLGDLLLVAVNTDRSVKSIKGSSRPVIHDTDRAQLIAALEMVDYVTLFDDPEPTQLITALKPDVLVKGGDWRSDEIVGSQIVEQYGGKVAVIPYLKGFSTSGIIERIRS